MNTVTLILIFSVVASSFICGKVIYDVKYDADDEWWKHATFYQIYPRSFKDSNGDGIGDLQGIISKLDHLVNAGITATWISPIYKSPGVDAGYDISDYRDIDEMFGTMEDFEELIKTATELGLKIIMDFVPNHTSDQHEWFIQALNGTEDYKDYYVWRNGNGSSAPNNWLSNFKYSAWKYEESQQQWYYHAFAEAQPDLNYRNPKVVQEMKDVLIYWLDKGVYGFRMDAVPGIFEDLSFADEPLNDGYTYDVYNYNCLNHIYTHNQPETFDMIYQWRALLDDYTDQNGGASRVIMTEAYESYEYIFKYYGNDTHNGAHFSFNFNFITGLSSNSTAEDVVDIITNWFDKMPSKYVANWVLGNHDQHRIASRMGTENVDGFNMLSTLLPGVAVTYNGEEIGMEDGEVTYQEGQDPSACNSPEEDFPSNSRDFERTPFHWNNATNAGFSTANQTWLPVSSKYLTNNLLEQSTYDKKSHYHIYQALMQLRKQNTFVYGNLDVEVLDTYVLGFTRALETDDTFVFVFNMGNSSSVVDLTTFSTINDTIQVILTSVNSKRDKGDILSANSIQLDAHEALVAKVVVNTGTETPSETNAAIKLEVLSLFIVMGLCFTFLS